MTTLSLACGDRKPKVSPLAALQSAHEILLPLAGIATAQRAGAHGDVKVVIDQNLCRRAARTLALVEEALARLKLDQLFSNPRAEGDGAPHPQGR